MCTCGRLARNPSGASLVYMFVFEFVLELRLFLPKETRSRTHQLEANGLLSVCVVYSRTVGAARCTSLMRHQRVWIAQVSMQPLALAIFTSILSLPLVRLASSNYPLSQGGGAVVAGWP